MLSDDLIFAGFPPWPWKLVRYDVACITSRRECGSELARRVRGHDVDSGGERALEALVPLWRPRVERPHVDDRAGLVHDRGHVDAVDQHLLEQLEVDVQLADPRNKVEQHLEPLAQVLGRGDRAAERERVRVVVAVRAPGTG